MDPAIAPVSPALPQSAVPFACQVSAATTSTVVVKAIILHVVAIAISLIAFPLRVRGLLRAPWGVTDNIGKRGYAPP